MPRGCYVTQVEDPNNLGVILRTMEAFGSRIRQKTDESTLGPWVVFGCYDMDASVLEKDMFYTVMTFHEILIGL